ncbi:MAG TPA: tetratricopeptide repeat protein [Vicinamibacteria bacterium]|nr:tetratricopeptide repeat protein [Vicinamibacteria bacterium]
MRNRLGRGVGFALVLAAAVTGRASAQDLKDDKSWDKVSSENRSVVLGRFEGQFGGTDFKEIRLKVLDIHNDKTLFLDVVEGLGFIEELLPPGRYALIGVEATYFPLVGTAIDPTKYRPVKQRFAVNPQNGQAVPTFEVPADRPTYIGTIRAGAESDGLVYKGHLWRVLDEYDKTMERLKTNYPQFAASLAQRSIEPLRSFVLKPSQPEPALEFVGVDDPIDKSRQYIAEGKYESAISWLATFLPASDAERLEAELLIGEALLGDSRYEEAIVRLGEVLQAEPGTTRALRLLARAHALNGNLEDAQALFEALAEIYPDDTEVNLQLGYLYAIGSDPLRSAAAFRVAFRDDTDYLLHDLAPFLVALRAIESRSARFQPPTPKENIDPPRWLRSRRGSEEEQGSLAVLIDHEGNVVAAQLSSSTGPMPFMVISMVRANFEPAAVNGVPVPAVLSLPGGQGIQ